ncbi:hypothetical protein LY76DRAFT_275135 [Colletotrichum caudatum]|nr:hypothetical protein LY76DRAFT_275135 [Colletotrichum caudatum]
MAGVLDSSYGTPPPLPSPPISLCRGAVGTATMDSADYNLITTRDPVQSPQATHLVNTWYNTWESVLRAWGVRYMGASSQDFVGRRYRSPWADRTRVSSPPPPQKKLPQTSTSVGGSCENGCLLCYAMLCSSQDGPRPLHRNHPPPPPTGPRRCGGHTWRGSMRSCIHVHLRLTVSSRGSLTRSTSVGSAEQDSTAQTESRAEQREGGGLAVGPEASRVVPSSTTDAKLVL